MKREKRNKKTISYLRIVLPTLVVFALGITTFGVLSARNHTHDLSATEREAKQASNEKHSMSDLAKNTMSQEEYEKLVDREYKESGGMVRFGSYRQRYNVNKTTLFLGTYLIEFDAMNETYYRLANLSKSQHKQDIGYYKSEISDALAEDGKEAEDNIWVEITGSDLNRLTEGANLEESSLDGYWISCVITPDGAYDPKTGARKDILGEDPYDFLNLPELLPLKLQYDAIEEKAGASDSELKHNYYTRNLLISRDAEILETDKTIFDQYSNYGRNEITNRCDIEIQALKAYRETILEASQDGSEEKAAILLDTYAKEDALRKAEIYRYLAIDDSKNYSALHRISDLIENEARNNGEFKKKEAYLEAVSESIANCKNSYQLFLSMKADVGTTVISEYGYVLHTNLVDSAYENTLKTDGEKWLIQGIALKNIEADTIKDANTEKALLQTALVPEALRRYENATLTSVSAAYLKAEASKQPDATKQDLLQAQYEGAEKQLKELESLLKATCSRLEQEEALSLTEEQLLLATGWRTQVFNDPYGPLAKQSITNYINWLSKLYEEICAIHVDEDLEALSEDLEARMERAELENDEETLRKLAILAEENGLDGPYDAQRSDRDLQTFLDHVKALSEGELHKELYDLMLKDQEKQNYSIVEATYRLLGDEAEAYGSGELDAYAKTLMDRGTKDGSQREAARTNENYVDTAGAMDKSNAYAAGLNKENSVELTEDQMQELLASCFGQSFDSLPADSQAAAIVALHRFGKENQSEACLNYAKKLLTRVVGRKNPLLYKKYEADGENEYISMGAVDKSRKYSGYRFVSGTEYNTLSRIAGASSYSFMGNTVTKANGETEVLAMPVGIQIDDYIKSGTEFYYISEADAMLYLRENAEYITDTPWGILVTASMEQDIEEVKQALEEAMGK